MKKESYKITYFHNRIEAIGVTYVNKLPQSQPLRPKTIVDNVTIAAIVNGEIKINEVTTKQIIDYFNKSWNTGNPISVVELLIDQESLEQFNNKSRDKQSKLNESVENGRQRIKKLIIENLDMAYLDEKANLIVMLERFESNCKAIVESITSAKNE